MKNTNALASVLKGTEAKVADEEPDPMPQSKRRLLLRQLKVLAAEEGCPAGSS